MSLNLRHVRWVAIGLIVIGLVLVGVWGARVYRTARSLLAHANEAQALLDSNPLDADLATLGKLVNGVRDDVVALKRDVGWAVKLGPAFRWVPKVGPLLAQSPALLDLADALTELGALLWDDAALSLTLLDYGLAPLDALVIVQPRIVADVPAAHTLVERATMAYSGIDVAVLPDRLQVLGLLETALPLAGDALAWVEFVPDLLGVGAPRTYLLLVLNEGELRPGGGFITGVGEVRIASGTITEMTFSDSYAVDDFSQPYPDPPKAIQQFMNIDLWVFRDSNWSPDFPTSIRQGLELYRPTYPVTVDGVVAVDQYAVQKLVDAIGPLVLPGEDAPVTGEKLLEYIYASWAPVDGQFDSEWWKERKSFMEPLAEAILARVEGGGVDWAALVNVGLALVEEKHVQVYMTDTGAGSLLAAQGWDGGLRTPTGDYVMVAEANVGFNKASARLERAFTYDVDLTQSPPRATMTLSYTHTSQVEVACKSEARYDPEYTQMTDRCYWGYLRLYVPAGAQFVDASRHPIPPGSVASGEAWFGQALITMAPEGPYTVFEQAFLLPTTTQTAIRFVYTLPDHVVQSVGDGTWSYDLYWQKQAGLYSVPARVILRLPRNAVLCSLQPRSDVDDSGVLLYDVDLQTDQHLSVCYRLTEDGK